MPPSTWNRLSIHNLSEAMRTAKDELEGGTHSMKRRIDNPVTDIQFGINSSKMAKTDEVMPWKSNAILKDIFPQADGVLINDLLHQGKDLTQVASCRYHKISFKSKGRQTRRNANI